MGSEQHLKRARREPRVGKVDALLDAKLKGVEWGEFRIDNLFEKLNLRTKNKVFDKLKDTSPIKTDEFSLPLVNAKVGNNGIMFYGREKDFDSAKMTIDIISNGAIATGTVYAQPNKTAVLWDAYLLGAKVTTMNREKLLYFTTSLEKSIKRKFGWEYKAVWSKVREENIQLPTKNNEIDFEFMENFIAELEAQKIERLEAYLVENGLKEYRLSQEEEGVLRDFESGNVEWGEFKIGDLFEKIKTNKLALKAKDLPKQIIGEYTLPCLTSSFQNQGLNYFVPREGATILKNVISIPSNSDIYRAYFQSQDFTVLSDAYTVQWVYDGMQLSNNQYLFTVPCINKVTDLKIYSYKNKLGGWNIVKNKLMKLPTKNNQPDYALMQTLISAVQKLVVKDLVLYVERKRT